MFSGLSHELLYNVNRNTYADSLCYNFVKSCEQNQEFQITFCEQSNLRFRALCELFPSIYYPKQFYKNLSIRTVIYYSAMPFINIFYRNGKQQICTFEEINDYLLSKDTFIKEERMNDIDSLILGVPDNNIPKQLRIILSNTITSSDYEPVLYNDVLSSDLVFAVLKDEDFINSRLESTMSILNKCCQNNYIIIAYNENKLLNKTNIKSLIAQCHFKISLFSKNVFIIDDANKKDDYKGIKKLLEGVKENPQLSSLNYRDVRCKKIIAKIEATYSSDITLKGEILQAIHSKNSSYSYQLDMAQKDSNIFWSLLNNNIAYYMSKTKQKLLINCRQILFSKISIADDHILEADVYNDLSSIVSSFVKDFNGIVTSTDRYDNMGKYVKLPFLNINNIFKGIMRCNYLSSQFKMSYRNMPICHIVTLKHQQTEAIISILSKNIDTEIKRYLTETKEVIDKNILALNNSNFTVSLNQLQNDILSLQKQQNFFRKLSI